MVPEMREREEVRWEGKGGGRGKRGSRRGDLLQGDHLGS